METHNKSSQSYGWCQDGELGQSCLLIWYVLIYYLELIILFAGGYDASYDNRDEILEYSDGVWDKVGNMKNKRGAHGVSVVNYHQVCL